MAVIQGSGCAGPLEARRFARLFVSLIAGAGAAIAALNWLVNPWALYPARLLPPRVRDDRSDKCWLLDRYRPRPEQLVVGSSRMMRFEPAYLERRTGLRTFNAAVAGGTPTDALVFTRHAARALQAPLRRVIVGVELHSFEDSRRSYLPLAQHRLLGRFLPGGGGSAGAVEALPLLLSTAQARDAWRTVRRVGGRIRSVPEDPFAAVLDADGYESWNDKDQHDALGGGAEHRRRADQCVTRRFGPPTTLDPVCFRDFQLLLRFLKRRRIHVTVIATPMLEPLRDCWRRNGMARLEQETLARVEALAAAHGARFVDFSRVASFGGDPEEFYDVIHPRVATTRRMIDALCRYGVRKRSAAGIRGAEES